MLIIDKQKQDSRYRATYKIHIPNHKIDSSNAVRTEFRRDERHLCDLFQVRPTSALADEVALAS